MKPKLRKGFTLIELITVITIIAVLASIAIVISRTVLRTANTNNTLSNLNYILTYIGIFQQEKNALPSGSGSFSNDHLRELFSEGLMDGGAEELFFVFGSRISTKKPDGIIGDSGAPDALEAGTCGFAYVANLNAGTTSGAPIMMDAYADGVNFDTTLHGGRVLVGLLNGSVKIAKANGAKAQNESGIDYTSTTNEGLFGVQSGDVQLLQPST